MQPPRCPITQEFMRDPVLAADGQTYERSAILEWFKNHNTSPYTGAILTSKELITNWAVKQMMEDYYNPPAAVASTEASAAVSVAPVAIKPSKPLPEITVSQNIFTFDTKKYLGIELNCGSSSDLATNRKPVIIIGVIDVSGSMGERATPFNPSGENDGFSRLDLVKHSIVTIQKSLQPGDRIAIIAFSSEARLVLDVTEVSTNERIISSRIDSLQNKGSTNIWAGLKMAIDLANRQDNESNNTSIMLLTDGVANIEPPRGTLSTFESYFKPMLGKFSIHTFAYGYDVDSALVSQIANMSQGVFGYIPDGTMVGTVFINTMSAILSTVYNDVLIDIKRQGTDINQSEKIYLGSILYGQPRTILIPFESDTGVPEYFYLCYNNGFYSIENCCIAREIASPLSEFHLINMIVKDALTKFLLYGSLLTNYTTEALSRLQTFVSEFLPYSSNDNIFIRDVIIDCCDDDPNKGQIGKSIANQKWFKKWGTHYLKSIASAYRQEWCLNFKDLGPQHFTSSTFAAFREKIEKIFLEITPPIPSITGREFTFNSTLNQGPVAFTASPTYSSIPLSYYNQSGGCFTGNWNVMLADGTVKCVKDISPGDVVISNDSPIGQATITHIIRLRVNEPILMCSPNGLVGITPYHPFWKTNPNLTHDWEFPMQTLSKNSFNIYTGEYIYDFIIDQGFTVALEGGYNVACLGHECQDSDIIKHEYFGTHHIIDDLKDHEDWTTGYITLNEWRFVRNSNGLVCKLEW